jgi:flagellar hook-associated protein 1 FlgK
MAEVVSSNISNAHTDGYGRRSVDISTHRGGVRVDGITRHSNPGLLADRRLAQADVGLYQSTTTALKALSRDFGEVGDGANLGSRLAAFEKALVSAASDPASEQRLGDVVGRLKDVTATLRNYSHAIRTQREAADSSIATDVETLNTSLKQVERFNADIKRAVVEQADTTDLLDARQVAIDKIAEIAPLREIDRGYGQVALMTTSGAMLIDGPAATFSFDRATLITPDMTLASGALSGVSQNGDPLDMNNGFGRLKGGSLAAAFELRDTTLPNLQADLDAIAQDLITRFEDSGVDPTLSAGDPGLLTDNGSAFDAVDLVGLSERLKVNTAVDPSAGGALSRLRDGMNAATTGPIGNNTQLNAWADALRASQTVGTGGLSLSVAGRIADFNATAGHLRVNAEEELSFKTARWETLRSAEKAEGVDTDQEIQQLMLIEQAYSANARVMQTVDMLLKKLMEI